MWSWEDVIPRLPTPHPEVVSSVSKQPSLGLICSPVPVPRHRARLPGQGSEAAKGSAGQRGPAGRKRTPGVSVTCLVVSWPEGLWRPELLGGSGGLKALHSAGQMRWECWCRRPGPGGRTPAGPGEGSLPPAFTGAPHTRIPQAPKHRAPPQRLEVPVSRGQ
uniref:Uncharacterized protein n=1 Tax=Molossus molossus TaxID=27622 RepID=A0A7J8EEK0_MOLMO|nr:hypothetical protein HJG59_008949 [Molossus molossus]